MVSKTPCSLQHDLSTFVVNSSTPSCLLLPYTPQELVELNVFFQGSSSVTHIQPHLLTTDTMLTNRMLGFHLFRDLNYFIANKFYQFYLLLSQYMHFPIFSFATKFKSGMVSLWNTEKVNPCFPLYSAPGYLPHSSKRYVSF